MFGQTYNNQLPVGRCGGALSHIYIQHPPLRCNVPETQGLHYDDANKLLLSPTSDQVLSWKIGLSAYLNPPDSDFIGEGPVLSIRYSLDRKFVGIQRSIHEILFRNRDTGVMISRRCRPDTESILGFFWTDCPSCNVVLVKTSGLDLLLYEPDMNTLRLVEVKRINVSWFVYTHESRMVLLASGMQGTVFSGFQFSSGGIIRLPRFEMTMTKTEANQKPVLAEEDIHIVIIYGRIYTLQFDRAGMLIYLYRFYRDAIVQQGTIPVYSTKISVSVVDNVLVIHQVDSKVAILYDIFLDSISPISAPLPLHLRASPGGGKQKTQVEDASYSAYGGTIYGDSWIFLVPDLICDIDNGLLWRISLDLEAIVASSSDIPSVLEFLQRRRSDPTMVKSLCLEIMKSLILERKPISIITKSMDVLLASYSHTIKTGNILQSGDFRPSNGQPVDSSTAVTEENQSQRDERTSIGQVSLSGTENEPREHTEFEGDANLGEGKVRASESLAFSGEREGKGKNVVADSSNADSEQPSLHSEVVEHDGNLPNSCIKQGIRETSVAVSPDEMYHFVFALVEDELGGDPTYLFAIIIEFIRSVCKEHLKVHANLYVMAIQLLAQNGRYGEIALLVINKILEPSKEVALQLIESGRQDPPTRKLGMDMLRQLSLHHDYVTSLLQNGCYIEGLRYARKNKVITVQPALFLEAALATGEPMRLATVLRFFSDFLPGFSETMDCGRYSRILVEMS